MPGGIASNFRLMPKKLVKTADIYRGVVPFVVLQIIGLGMLWIFPELATWLPDQLFSNEPIAQEDWVPSAGSAASVGSPVTDDFSDLLDPPSADKPKPYMDNFENLVPKP